MVQYASLVEIYLGHDVERPETYGGEVRTPLGTVKIAPLPHDPLMKSLRTYVGNQGFRLESIKDQTFMPLSDEECNSLYEELKILLKDQTSTRT